ncbi:hypothetical protein BDC45DRAFT_510353 [Circinella umbellata]|nr:hypothetical protein BDC45DRAFT_510353 [Circinella umbellata]
MSVCTFNFSSLLTYVHIYQYVSRFITIVNICSCYTYILFFSRKEGFIYSSIPKMYTLY